MEAFQEALAASGGSDTAAVTRVDHNEFIEEADDAELNTKTMPSAFKGVFEAAKNNNNGIFVEGNHLFNNPKKVYLILIVAMLVFFELATVYFSEVNNLPDRRDWGPFLVSMVPGLTFATAMALTLFVLSNPRVECKNVNLKAVAVAYFKKLQIKNYTKMIAKDRRITKRKMELALQEIHKKKENDLNFKQRMSKESASFCHLAENLGDDGAYNLHTRYDHNCFKYCKMLALSSEEALKLENYFKQSKNTSIEVADKVMKTWTSGYERRGYEVVKSLCFPSTRTWSHPETSRDQETNFKEACSNVTKHLEAWIKVETEFNKKGKKTIMQCIEKSVALEKKYLQKLHFLRINETRLEETKHKTAYTPYLNADEEVIIEGVKKQMLEKSRNFFVLKNNANLRDYNNLKKERIELAAKAKEIEANKEGLLRSLNKANNVVFAKNKAVQESNEKDKSVLQEAARTAMEAAGRKAQEENEENDRLKQVKRKMTECERNFEKLKEWHDQLTEATNEYKKAVDKLNQTKIDINRTATKREIELLTKENSVYIAEIENIKNDSEFPKGEWAHDGLLGWYMDEFREAMDSACAALTYAVDFATSDHGEFGIMSVGKPLTAIIYGKEATILRNIPTGNTVTVLSEMLTQTQLTQEGVCNVLKEAMGGKVSVTKAGAKMLIQGMVVDIQDNTQTFTTFLTMLKELDRSIELEDGSAIDMLLKNFRNMFDYAPTFELEMDEVDYNPLKGDAEPPLMLTDGTGQIIKRQKPTLALGF